MNNDKCPCSGKTKMRSDEEKKALINRLNRIEGQIRGIRSMVENDAYCTDVITQVAAAGAALGSFNRELLSAHIKTCVAEGMAHGDDSKTDELVSLLAKLMK